MQKEKLKKEESPLLVVLAYCGYCGRNPGAKPSFDPHAYGLAGAQDDGCVWNGFYDQDTCDYVCWCCTQVHYAKKRTGPYAGLFSEVPVVIKMQDISSPSANQGDPSCPTTISDKAQGETMQESPAIAYVAGGLCLSEL